MSASEPVAGSLWAPRGDSVVSPVSGLPVRGSERVDALPQSVFLVFQLFGSAFPGGELGR
jgi:hypothetical protein